MHHRRFQLVTTMRQDAQKQAGKFCTRKTAKNAKTHPGKPEKGETGCVLGAGGGSSGWRRMRADGKGRSEQGGGGRLLLSLAKMEGRTCLACRLSRAWTQPTGLQAPTTRTAGGPAGAPRCQILPHTNEKSQVPHKRYLTFWQGQKDLVSPAGSVGSRQSATGARSPLGTRFWSGCGRAQPGAGKGSVSPGSLRKSQRGRCWFGAASYFWRRIVYRLPLLPSKEKHLRQKDGQADQDHGRVGPGGI